jgi:hypothetical protein
MYSLLILLAGANMLFFVSSSVLIYVAGTLHVGDIVRVTRTTDPDLRKLDVNWVNPR